MEFVELNTYEQFNEIEDNHILIVEKFNGKIKQISGKELIDQMNLFGIKNGIGLYKETYLVSNNIKEIEKFNSLLSNKETERVCPNCLHSYDNGELMVMNYNKKFFFIPSLAKRINKKKHGPVLECNNCKRYFLEIEKITLLNEEGIECENIWRSLNNQ